MDDKLANLFRAKMAQSCDNALLLSQSTAYKTVLGCKIGVNIIALTTLLWGYYKTVISIYRLNVVHEQRCEYLLPFWLTFVIRQGYMFGVMGQTLTFVFLSLERIMATFRKDYAHKTSKTVFVISTAIILTFCFCYTYIYMGYDAQWDDMTEFFTQANEFNAHRISSFIYYIVSFEGFSLLFYNLTYLLNSREKNKINIHEKRVTQITKSLAEKYQIDENRKVARLMLPVCWFHFILYTASYGGFIIFVNAIWNQSQIEVYMCVNEMLGFITFYPYIFIYRILSYFVRKQKTLVVQGKETTADYFNQMNELFRSNPKVQSKDKSKRR
ncbi:hypothetical protein QR680_018003 [Steinernema hermaphroditum]|uniref:G-protein coupled receptors family 1 profile domain-containing protein n=1 Tax=Steinernema hermaphroditum TaxID=289476 RepID=A0AA39HIN8_9BILA|nr:hypothetical protein QR680_018003 [Steinernema hermaphroditum]